MGRGGEGERGRRGVGEKKLHKSTQRLVAHSRLFYIQLQFSVDKTVTEKEDQE
jgi:hypothetical protein